MADRLRPAGHGCSTPFPENLWRCPSACMFPVARAGAAVLYLYVMNLSLARVAIVCGSLLLTACAASSLPGYQNAYRAYNVPQPLFDRIKVKFREHGLEYADISRDATGRVQLTGNYRNEDEVDQAFTIVQSIVGMKSTSPFYPQNIKEKRWEVAAGKALNSYAHDGPPRSSVAVKRALVVGLNHFADSRNLKEIQGRDDAIVVQGYLKRAGYSVTTLLDERATQANIEAALNNLDWNIGPNDDVFIYISSHGTPPVPTPGGQDYRKMSIVAYDSGDRNTMRMNDATEFYLYIQKHSVPDTLVQNVARRPSHSTRVLIDTCYSGDMLDDIRDESTAYILQTNGGEKERAGISLASWTTADFTSKGIRFAADPGDKVGTAKAPATIDRTRNGYTIITATSVNEKSWGPSGGNTFESPIAGEGQIKGSFFTQSLFAYLDRNNGQLGPAFRDARAFTSIKAVEASHGKEHQTPRQYSTIPDDQNAIN
ncbi:Caspase domain-containing protein [Burkholderia sp. Ch1-1]|nr:Caspase domain-containing protein [Burkholderia sp. Ch1-1]